MTQHSLAIIGLSLAACGVPVLLIGLVTARLAGKRSRGKAWQGGATVLGAIFTVGAICVGFGISEWNNAHFGPPAAPTYGNPLQDPSPDNGCPDGPLDC